MKPLYIWIRRADLEDKCACNAGLELFDAILAEQNDLRARRGNAPRVGKIRIPWTVLSWCWLSQHGNHQAWLYDNGIAPLVSFARVNLAGANLARANLAGANLAGANLARVNLARVNLEGADLANVDLGNWERGPDGYARRKVPA